MKMKRITMAANSIAALAAENEKLLQEKEILLRALQMEEDKYNLTAELFERLHGFYPSLSVLITIRRAAINTVKRK